MTDMTGTCPFCGQTRLVEADTQQEADILAGKYCTCDNLLKKQRILEDNIDELCGANAQTYGMDQLIEEAIDVLKAAGTLCLRECADSIAMRTAGTSISIRRSKEGVKVERKKVSSVKLEV